MMKTSSRSLMYSQGELQTKPPERFAGEPGSLFVKMVQE
jgi:hypothetical protein